MYTFFKILFHDYNHRPLVGTDISDPKVGYSSFWIQASAQWICLIMYSWTLVAPKLFPDRDFGGTA